MNALTELLCCLFFIALSIFGCSKIEIIDAPKKLCKDTMWVTSGKATREEKDTTTLHPIEFIVDVDEWENENVNIE